MAKSQRVTNSGRSITALIELDPFGGEIGSWAGGTRSTFNMQQQPHRYTSYERDANGSDEAMFRRFNRWHARFDQPDPYEGSYNAADPQSFNRYTYVQNDPVNFVDPTGLVLAVSGDSICQEAWMLFHSYVNQSHISFVTANLRGSGASLGTMIGRIGAHEIIQHRLLGVPQEGAMKDITSSRVWLIDSLRLDLK